MQANELIDKALEIEQLLWWLKYPELQSFFLRYGWGSDDEGSAWSEQEETRFILTTDVYDPEEFSENHKYWDYENHPNFSVSTYPCERDDEIYARIYRPQMTDIEIQDRIDTILSMINNPTLTPVERTKLAISAKQQTGIVYERKI